MSTIKEVLRQTEHRPTDLPSGSWQYHQEWQNVLMLHWKVPYDKLRSMVPEALELDTHKNEAYVSLIGFTMHKIRLKNLPSVWLMSHFEEIDIRTYLKINGRIGFYFLNVEASKLLPATSGRILSGFPYEKATIHRSGNTLISVNSEKQFYLDTEYEVKGALPKLTELDKW